MDLTRREVIAGIGAVGAMSAVGGEKIWLPRKDNLRLARYSAKSYVQNGLVLMWDVYENSGWGKFNPNRGMNWPDLVRGAIMRGWSWNNTCGYIDGSYCPLNRAYSDNVLTMDMTKGATVECCSKACYGGPQHDVAAGAYAQWGVSTAIIIRFGHNWSLRRDGQDVLAYTTYISNHSKMTQTTIVDSNRIAYAIHDADFSTKISSGTTQVPASLAFNVFFNSVNGSTSVGEATFSNLRVYNRQLTEDEVKYNRMIDKVRYGLP